jgi:hypothetical protein
MNTVIYVDDLDDDKVIRSVAKQYIRSMVEIQQDMFLDEPSVNQEDYAKRINATVVREMAESYADEMISEFRLRIINEIKQVTFNAKFEVERKLKSQVTFDE